MKSRYWNWLINSILALLYSLAILILFEPWLRFVYTGAHFGEVETAQRLWMVGSTLAGIILADRLARLDRGLFRVLIVIAVLILAVLLIYWLEWPLVVFAPVLLLMFIFGFRFTLYETLADYNSDFILGIFFLLLNILVQNKIELHFDYLYVISFFLVGISFTVIYNIKHLGRGLLQHRNFLAAAIIICLIFSTIIFSLLMSALLDRANLDMAVQALG
ncbi:MAG: hypothetical protein UMV23_06895, partial [Halanaerobium sp.]|nr:hypothetical protein [Halanaerobium sp.]